MLSEALIESKSLRLVHCDEPDDYTNVNSLQTLASSPTITIKIICDPPRDDNLPFGSTMEFVRANIAKNKQLSASSFLLVNRVSGSAFFRSCIWLIIHEHFSPPTTHSLNVPQKPSVRDELSFSTDSVMKVSDAIWADIFALATVPSSGATVSECHFLRGNLAQVCQQFSVRPS
jgi:hypothetical protein